MALQKPDPWPFVAVGAMAALFFLYGATITFWPWWVTAILLVLWLPMMLTTARLFNEGSRDARLVPLVGLGIYVLFLVVDVLF